MTAREPKVIDGGRIPFIWMAIVSCIVIVMCLTYKIVITRGAVGPSSSTVIPADRTSVGEKVPGVLQAVNDYRKSKGLKPLSLNAKLNQSSQAKAEDLVAKHYWSHTAPDGTEAWAFFQQAGYDYTRAGENLAKCYASPNALVQAWIASPTHEKVLRGDYAEVGFGSAHSTQDGCNYVVGHFGRR